MENSKEEGEGGASVWVLAPTDDLSVGGRNGDGSRRDGPVRIAKEVQAERGQQVKRQRVIPTGQIRDDGRACQQGQGIVVAVDQHVTPLVAFRATVSDGSSG